MEGGGGRALVRQQGLCYDALMVRRDPDFSERVSDQRHRRGDKGIVISGGSTASAFLTDEELEAINKGRSEQHRIERKAICGAATKTREAVSEVCTFPAGSGTDHLGFGKCKFHGGLSPSGKKAAALEVARSIADRRNGEIMTQLDRIRFGGDRAALPFVSPEEALIEEVQRSTAMVRWLEERIGMWPTDVAANDDIGGLPSLVAETSKGVPGATDHQAWLLLYRQEREHAAKVAKMAIDAGVAQAQVKIAQVQGAMMSKALRVILTTLGLTLDQAERARLVVPRVLQALSSGQIESLPEDLSSNVEAALAEEKVIDVLEVTADPVKRG